MPIFVGAAQSSFVKSDGGVGISTMTTTQRDALSDVKPGQFIYNRTTNFMEYYDGSAWKPIDSPPSITNFTIDGGSAVTSAKINVTGGGNATIVVNGANFDATSGTVIFEPEAGGSNVNTQSIVRNSSSQFTVTVTRSDFQEANDPYAIKVTNGSGLAATLASALDVNVAPVFATAANTNIGTLPIGGTNFSNLTTVAATDADGDAVTHTITAGGLPSGVSLNTNGTFSGTVGGTATNYTFTVQAATAYANTTRQFLLTVAALPSGGNVTTSGNNRIHTYTSSGTFTTAFDAAVQVLVVAGGGGGAGSFAGGGGAGGVVHDPSGLNMDSSSSPYTITVGTGGQGGLGWQAVNGMRGNNGGDSAAFNFTAKGGGGGGSFDWTYNPSANSSQVAQIGGCGGGGAAVQGSMTASARNGAGTNQGNFSGATSYGTSGGNGQSSSQLTQYHGGGGGGASQAGLNAGSNNSGNGGAGQAISITGSSVTYAGGGGGSTQGGSAGSGGTGGGGAAQSGSTAAQAGTDGLGGGGGAAGYSGSSNARLGGDGGDGVVIIRYDKDDL